jgi:hypothetical protein
MDQGEFSCDFCNFVCRKAESDLFFKHLIKYHSNEPNFIVYCATCPRSFKKVNSLQKHYYREHRNVEHEDLCGVNGFHAEDQRNSGIEDEYDENKAREEFQHHVAKFLLGAREQAKLTQTALDMVKDSTKNLLTEYFDIVKKALSSKLNEAIGEQFQFTRDMDELFSAERIFQGLDSEYAQRAYYKQNFNLLVSFVTIVIL